MIAISSLYVTIILLRNAFKNLCLSSLSYFPLYPILILMCPFQLSYTYSLISISYSIKKFQPVFLFLFKDYLFKKAYLEIAFYFLIQPTILVFYLECLVY